MIKKEGKEEEEEEEEKEDPHTRQPQGLHAPKSLASPPYKHRTSHNGLSLPATRVILFLGASVGLRIT
ncbi:hypothetical protein E2C01_030690 [Portunus trituberculatus]|uniref:Uncharacterized protein n=1 Tax=Portunus trituberculatus TaxID=210409 RepID=A0A5B7EVJ7_PORTR|nr:hypothetical protein [Portunus trituberculatus]